MTTILLAGATGMVGREALALLFADGRVRQVVAPTRQPLQPHAKLRNPIVNSHDLHPGAEWWSADGAISALGTTRANAGSAAAYRAIDYDYALAVSTQVREAGATRFALTSSMGANPQSRFTYPRTKGELEDAVGLLGFQSLTLVRPGLLSGHRREHRPIEAAFGSLLRAIGPVLPAAARVSPATTVAALLVEAALTGRAGRHVVTSRMITLAGEDGVQARRSSDA